MLRNQATRHTVSRPFLIAPRRVDATIVKSAVGHRRRRAMNRHMPAVTVGQTIMRQTVYRQLLSY